MNNFPVKLNLRLDWSEMNLFGHINNVSYFKYIQASRVNYWEAAGLTDFRETNIGPILLSTGCQFIKPLHYPGNITIQARIEFIKTTSFGIHHQLLNSDNEICAEAHDVMVMYDFGKEEKVAVSEEFRERVRERKGKI